MIPKDSKEKAILGARAALDHKAVDLVVLEVKNVSSFTDYFIICSGNSDRQVQAIANHIEKTLDQRGFSPLGIEGKREGRWVLLDYGDVVIHIFYQPVREFYDLERLWADAPRVEVSPKKKMQRKIPKESLASDSDFRR